LFWGLSFFTQELISWIAQARIRPWPSFPLHNSHKNKNKQLNEHSNILPVKSSWEQGKQDGGIIYPKDGGGGGGGRGDVGHQHWKLLKYK
jgi:hypothetical protein